MIGFDMKESSIKMLLQRMKMNKTENDICMKRSPIWFNLYNFFGIYDQIKVYIIYDVCDVRLLW